MVYFHALIGGEEPQRVVAGEVQRDDAIVPASRRGEIDLNARGVARRNGVPEHGGNATRPRNLYPEMAAAFSSGDGNRHGYFVPSENGCDRFHGNAQALEISPAVNERNDREGGQDKAKQIGRAIALAGAGVAHGGEHCREAEGASIRQGPDSARIRRLHGR